MPEISKYKPEFDTTRRKLIGGVTLAIGLAAGLAGPAAAAGKMSRSAANYQPTPKGNARCDLCANWQPPDACKLVEGPISPNGWCSLFAPR